MKRTRIETPANLKIPPDAAVEVQELPHGVAFMGCVTVECPECSQKHEFDIPAMYLQLLNEAKQTGNKKDAEQEALTGLTEIRRSRCTGCDTRFSYQLIPFVTYEVKVKALNPNPNRTSANMRPLEASPTTTQPKNSKPTIIPFK